MATTTAMAMNVDSLPAAPKPMKKMKKPVKSAGPMSDQSNGTTAANKVMKKPARRSSVMSHSAPAPGDGGYGDALAAYGSESSTSAPGPNKAPKPMKKMARRPSQLPGAMSSADGMQTLPLELLEEDEAVASLPVTPISDSNGTGSPTPSQQMKLAGLKQRGRQASLSQHAMTASGDLDAMAAALAETSIDEVEEEGNELI